MGRQGQLPVLLSGGGGTALPHCPNRCKLVLITVSVRLCLQHALTLVSAKMARQPCRPPPSSTAIEVCAHTVLYPVMFVLTDEQPQARPIRSHVQRSERSEATCWPSTAMTSWPRPLPAKSAHRMQSMLALGPNTGQQRSRNVSCRHRPGNTACSPKAGGAGWSSLQSRRATVCGPPMSASYPGGIDASVRSVCVGGHASLVAAMMHACTYARTCKLDRLSNVHC